MAFLTQNVTLKTSKMLKHLDNHENLEKKTQWPLKPWNCHYFITVKHFVDDLLLTHGNFVQCIFLYLLNSVCLLCIFLQWLTDACIGTVLFLWKYENVENRVRRRFGSSDYFQSARLRELVSKVTLKVYFGTKYDF